MVAWGTNTNGQADVPAGLNGVTAIAAGEAHTVALKGDGTVMAWGLDDQGQATVPAGLSGVVAIAAGARHTVAMKNDGTIVAWGADNLGQSTVPVGLPLAATGLPRVTAIAAGGSQTVYLISEPQPSLVPDPSGFTADGRLLLKLGGTPGRAYPVQASFNLRNWTTAATVVATNGSATFPEPGLLGGSGRYFRAILP